jgi:hypothetical protein
MYDFDDFIENITLSSKDKFSTKASAMIGIFLRPWSQGWN